MRKNLMFKILFLLIVFFIISCKISRNDIVDNLLYKAKNIGNCSNNFSFFISLADQEKSSQIIYSQEKNIYILSQNSIDFKLINKTEDTIKVLISDNYYRNFVSFLETSDGVKIKDKFINIENQSIDDKLGSEWVKISPSDTVLFNTLILENTFNCDSLRKKEEYLFFSIMISGLYFVRKGELYKCSNHLASNKIKILLN